MSPSDFCQWLSGFVGAAGTAGLCPDQTARIKEKLSEVKETKSASDFKLDPDKIAKALGATHRGHVSRSLRIYC